MIYVNQCPTLKTLVLILLVALLVHKVTSATYFVIPDGYSSHHTDANTFTLQHYLSNTSKYFVSHSQFHFMQGQYALNSDLIIKDIDNFTIIGPRIGQSTIICTSPATIVIMNVNDIKFQNIDLLNCIKNQKNFFNTSYSHPSCARDYSYRQLNFSKITDYCTTLLLCNCSSVIIYTLNINATVNISFTAILIMNIKDSSLVNVRVQVNSLNCTTFNNHSIEISGLKVFISLYDKMSDSGSLTVDNFYYSNYKMCEHHLVCVIITMLLLNDRHDVKNRFTIQILNSKFSHMKNSSVLCSFVETMKGYEVQNISRRFITIRNSTFSDNTGNPNLSMFNIELNHFE